MSFKFKSRKMDATEVGTLLVKIEELGFNSQRLRQHSVAALPH